MNCLGASPPPGPIGEVCVQAVPFAEGFPFVKRSLVKPALVKRPVLPQAWHNNGLGFVQGEG